MTHVDVDQLCNSDFIYFWKGRVALFALLKAIGVGQGDDVVVPGFTCVVVPNAVLYTGATPVYADIDSTTYNVTLETLQAVVTKQTKAIVVQSTFGLSPDLDEILQFAETLNIPVIDDCTHGLGGSYKGTPNGFVTDAAFFSTQWSKPLSTGLGGFAVARTENLAKRLKFEVKDYASASMVDDSILAAQRFVRPLADIPQLHYPLVNAYRWLTQKAGLSVGSSSGDEVAGTSMPEGYCKLSGSLQKKAILENFNKLDPVLDKRQHSADYYDNYFDNISGVVTPARPEYAHHGMLRYSVQVYDNQRIFEKGIQNNIAIGNWFDSPLYPVYGDLSPWKYSKGCCPVAEALCKKIVNLPTDKKLSKGQLDLLFKH